MTRALVTAEDTQLSVTRQCALQHRRDLIRSATCFSWWPLRIKKRQGPKTTWCETFTRIANPLSWSGKEVGVRILSGFGA